MEKHPMVSIIMTCYNREKYIGEAIESVLQNGYNDFELIIVDDGSTDDSIAIVSSYLGKDRRIRFYKNENNLGDYPNRNKASRYATGKYLVNVDSDDTMFPGILNNWVVEMEKREAEFGIFVKTEQQSPFQLSPEKAIRMHFYKQPVLSYGPCATIVANAFFGKMKGFPESYGPANDMYHHVKLATSTNTVFFPYPLVNYRVHEAQERNNVFGYLYNSYRYKRDALRNLSLPLTKKEITFLDKKNKRRFILNLAGYFVKTRSLNQTLKAVRLAEFSAKDFFTGLIHF